MNPSVAPLSFQTMQIGTLQQQQAFLFKLGQLLNQMVSTITATQSSGGLTTLTTPQTFALGALGATGSVNAAGSLFVGFTFTISVATTITITNLPIGAIVMFSGSNTSGSARSLIINASTPGSVSYTTIQAQASSLQNLLTGWTFNAGASHSAIGLAITGPGLFMVGQ